MDDTITDPDFGKNITFDTEKIIPPELLLSDEKLIEKSKGFDAVNSTMIDLTTFEPHTKIDEKRKILIVPITSLPETAIDHAMKYLEFLAFKHSRKEEQ